MIETLVTDLICTTCGKNLQGPEPTGEAGYQPANAVIAFALYQQHGQGTRMSHATIDEHKTLCGHTITEDWMFDGAWGGGPECTRCQDRARALSCG